MEYYSYRIREAVVIPQHLLLYCRPGFEPDLGAEIQEKAALKGWAGHAEAQPNSGYVRFVLAEGVAANGLHRDVPLSSLVFARQSLVALPPLMGISRENRLTPIIEQVKASGWNF